MANITLIIRVRRIEGRNKVEDSVIAAELASMVEDLGEFEVEDMEGETATYEVTGIRVLVLQPELVPYLEVGDSQCRWCNTPLTQIGTGRPAEFCSDAHRQADYRHRHNLA